MADEIQRRELLRVVAGTALATKAVLSQTHQFFTPAELAIAQELTEIIIPADDHSPGAKAAKCAEYIDFRLAETDDAEARRRWREGLKLVNSLSQKMNGLPFLQATPEQRVGVVTSMASNEEEPKSPAELFFVELKRRTVNAYYTSKIGIQELEYQGNVYLAEFVGYDTDTGDWHMTPKKP
ncbi:MAG TPA: gluconate 2-dehydrogenase subunit 3 family protein [Bryobacteraceae bacterium]|nr:gluconate 2-dehydrogenase subunit 3 family protein [Bryobacteraceae bacterium]